MPKGTPNRKSWDFTSGREPNIWDKRWEGYRASNNNPAFSTQKHRTHTRSDSPNYTQAKQEIAVMDALVNGPRTTYQIADATGLSVYVIQRTIRRLKTMIQPTEKGRWQLCE